MQTQSQKGLMASFRVVTSQLPTSSAADLATFKKDPAKYVPQYGGFCANAMSKRKANDIDPTVFFVVNGKLYVCSSPAAEKEFRSNETENIKKADENWETEYRWFY
jgi:YHS domain-containing protein